MLWCANFDGLLVYGVYICKQLFRLPKDPRITPKAVEDLSAPGGNTAHHYMLIKTADKELHQSKGLNNAL